MPGSTSNPNTAQPKSLNPSAAEAAAKAALEAKGYSGVKSLTPTLGDFRDLREPCRTQRHASCSRRDATAIDGRAVPVLRALLQA